MKDHEDFISLDTEDWAYVYGAQSVKSLSEPFVIGILLATWWCLHTVF